MNLSIKISVEWEEDGKVKIAKREALDFESAEEALGKLERYFNREEKEKLLDIENDTL